MDTVWLLSSPEDSIEIAWFADYLLLMSQIMQQDSTGIYSIDSVQKVQMYQIAESGAHIAPQAHAVLYLVDEAVFNYPIEKIAEEIQAKKGRFDEEKPKIELPTLAQEMKFKLYPNPNDGRMTLEYELKEKDGLLILHNISGKEVSRIALRTGKHKIPFTPSQIDNGVYIVRILEGNEQVHIGKVVIIK